MELKIPIPNKILATFLSVLFFFSSIISLFSLPLEMVFFNSENVFQALDDEKNQALIPVVVSELTGDVYFQSYSDKNIPVILKDTEEFKILISKYIPAEWASQIIHDFIEYSYEFINFKATESHLKLDISTLRQAIIENSCNISEDIINSKQTCPVDQSDTEGTPNKSIYELPDCHPDANSMEATVQILDDHIDNQFRQIPSKITIDYMFFWNKRGVENLFNSYNVIRWFIRLMPLVSIGLLILLSFTLSINRKKMMRWMGRLIIFSSAFSLLGLIIFSIGFNQFTTSIISNQIPGLIPGFDNLLLRIIQAVGFRTLTWTIVVSICTLIFGFLILTISKVFRKERRLKSDIEEVKKKSVKDIIPQTMEEIEAREKKKK